MKGQGKNEDITQNTKIQIIIWEKYINILSHLKDDK